MAFRAKDENWRFRAINRLTADLTNEQNSASTAAAFDLDLVLKTLAPGWRMLRRSEDGVERPDASTSSQPGRGVSYSVVAAQMAVSGRIHCDQFQIDFEGHADFEHDWGTADGNAPTR